MILPCLLPPFKNQPFQKLADKTLGLLLAGDFSTTLKEHQLEKEGLLLSLYAFRNLLLSPEINTFAQMALFKLIHGINTHYGFQERQGFKQDTRVLTQKEFLNLLQEALINLEKDESESHEAQLLESLLQSQVCYAFSLSTASQSKAFLNAFKAQYPKAKSFTTIEHCLLTAANGKNSFLMDVSHEPSQDISENDFAEHALQLVHDKTKSISDVIEDLKQALEKAFPVVADKLEKAIAQEVHVELNKKSIKKQKRLESTLTSSSALQNNPTNSQPQVQNLQAAVMNVIRDFCNTPDYEKVDGLVKMRAIMDNTTLGPTEKISQVITLAEWKKSDYDTTRFFHQEVRKRSPAVETFYQRLAALEVNNPEAIIGFLRQYPLNSLRLKDDSADNLLRKL